MQRKESSRIKRHQRIRKSVNGTPERPRLSVHRSSTNLYVQLIDDTTARTLYSFSSRDKSFAGQKPAKGKVPVAEKLGEFFGKTIKEKGFGKITFDRGGYLYHGRIKALADGLRKAGLDF